MHTYTGFVHSDKTTHSFLHTYVNQVAKAWSQKLGAESQTCVSCRPNTKLNTPRNDALKYTPTYRSAYVISTYALFKATTELVADARSLQLDSVAATTADVKKAFLQRCAF
jgi:hypothetical protein